MVHESLPRRRAAPLARMVTLAGVVVALAALAVAPAASADGWQVQPVAVSSSSVYSELNGIQCPSLGAGSTSSPCYAVGDEASAPGAQAALIETWTGSAWTVWHLGGPFGSSSSQLFSVSCPNGGTFCMAAGDYVSDGTTLPLVYTWDEDTGDLAQLTAPNAGPYGNYFTSVSCQSATFCVLVGPEQEDTWNGITITPESGPTNPGLSMYFAPSWKAVSCAGGQSASCTEVGFQPALDDTNAPVAESYVNGQWIVQTGTSPANEFSGDFPVEPANARSATLSGVSCTSAQSCQVVGVDQNATTNAYGIWGAVFNGQGWSLQSLPPAGADSLTAVTCPQNCWAVGQDITAGSYGLFADDINGSQVTSTSLPTPPGSDAVLNAVSCAQINYCEGVGRYYDSATNAEVAFAEHYSNAITTPSAPPAATASARVDAARVVFTPATSDGGAAITSYTVAAIDVNHSAGYVTVSVPADAVVDGQGSWTVDRLAGGDTYEFFVSAVNAVGTGPASARSNAVRIYEPKSGGGRCTPSTCQ